MSSTSKNPPRFLPTLTEVVHRVDARKQPPQRTLDPEEIVQSVLPRLSTLLESRLKAEIEAIVRSIVAEQLELQASKRMQELEALVRQVVTEKLLADIHSDKIN